MKNLLGQVPHKHFPSTHDGLISLCFWHSFIFTVNTPLWRFVRKNWKDDFISYTIAKLCFPSNIVEYLEENGIIHPGMHYQTEGEPIPVLSDKDSNIRMNGIDKAFAIHAGFSLLWMVCGYLQICYMHKLHPKAHKYFGYVTVMAFFMHCCGSANIVYADVVRHTGLPKLILLYALINSAFSLTFGLLIALIRAPGWRMRHQDKMVETYIYSLTGAGIIRTVSHIQHWMGNFGPFPCQSMYGGVASQCQVPYVNRLCLVGMFAACIYGYYVYHIRRNVELTQMYNREAAFIFATTLSLIVSSFLPDSEDRIHYYFGEPRTPYNSFVVCSGIFLIIFFNLVKVNTLFQSELAKAK